MGALGNLLFFLRLHQPFGAFVDQRIQGNAVDHVQRVEHIALGLGHLLAVVVAHQAVHIDLLEGHLIGELQGHHDHPGDPEEDDIETGHQHIGGMEGAQGIGVFRPAKGREGPQGGAEPGVQNVIVLAQRCVTKIVFGADLFLAAAHIDIAVGVIPGRNAVAPPELPGNTPVLQVAHPGEIHVLVVLGHELDVAIFHRGNGRLGQLFHGHEPLVGQVGFDDNAGAVASGHLQGVVSDFFQQAKGVQIVHDFLAGIHAVQAAIGLRHFFIEGRIRSQDVDHRQVMTLAHFIVVEVMGGGNFYAAGTKIRVHIIIGDDGDVALSQRQANGLADHVLVARVFRVHGHGGIAEHGLRAGGGDHQMAGAVGERVAEVPHVALFFHVLHFQVGDGRVQGRVPVDQTLAAVNQTFLVQAHKHFAHCVGQAVVHGETFTGPVHAGAHAAQLASDGAAGFAFPLPDLVEKLLPAQFVAVGAFAGQFAFHHHLGGDAGMVGAHLPQGVAALHAAVAHQGVHDGVLEGVTHVQAAGDIGGRDHDAEGITLAARLEMTGLFPVFIPGLLDAIGLVGFVHDHRF